MDDHRIYQSIILWAGTFWTVPDHSTLYSKTKPSASILIAEETGYGIPLLDVPNY